MQVEKFFVEADDFRWFVGSSAYFCLSSIPFHLSSGISSAILSSVSISFSSRYPSAFIKVSSHSSLIPLSAIKVSDGQSLICIEKSLFFPLKKSRIMNGIYFIYLMNYPLAGIFVPSQKLAPEKIHLKFSGENRIN